MNSLPMIMIASVNQLGYIGKDGDLICRSRYDLQRFRERSDNGVLIMGRKTYESLPKMLPNRSFVVVTANRREVKHPPGTDMSQVLFVSKIENAQNAAFRLADIHNRDKVVIAGGSSIFGYFLHQIEELYLTRFSDDTLGDAQFPVSTLDQMLVANRITKTDERTLYDDGVKLTFERYQAESAIDWFSGDIVKLCNGVRFRLSSVDMLVPREDGLTIVTRSGAFDVHKSEALIDLLMQQLDGLLRRDDRNTCEVNVAPPEEEIA